MKTLALWAAICVGAFGAAAGGAHAWLSGSPTRVAIIIDSSFAMRDELPRAQALAKRIAKTTRYAEFALFSPRARLHDFSRQVDAARLKAFGPRQLDKLADTAALEAARAADRIYLITNAGSSELASVPSGWTILSPASGG